MATKKIGGTLFLIAALAGCATSAYPTFTASGNSGYRLVCGGVFGDGDLGSCYQKAGEVCGSNGYRVQQTGVSSLIVECKEPGKEALELDLSR